jgi:hypothetical protein
MTKLFTKIASSIWDTGGWLMPDGKVTLSVQDDQAALKSGAVHFEPQKPYFQVKFWDLDTPTSNLIKDFMNGNPPPEDLEMQFRGVESDGERWKRLFGSDGRASFLKKRPLTSHIAAATGVDVFDRTWNDFHGTMSAPENEGRTFHDVLKKHTIKDQVLVALGKLNYMIDNGGFSRWIEEGYAFDTGDLLLKKLPHHNHSSPVLSKVHDLIGSVLKAYSEFGVKSFDELQHLLTGTHRGEGAFITGPDRDTMWHWFKNQKKSMFRFRGGVTAPYDLEYISGKWGHIKLDDDAINQELFDHYQKEASELEKEIDLIPRDEEGENRKKLKDKLGVLLGKQADVDSALEAIGYRLDLKKAWDAFQTGDWSLEAETALDKLDERYHETVSITSLATEAKEWFNATPDEVEVVAESDDVLPKTSSLKVAGANEFSNVGNGPH